MDAVVIEKLKKLERTTGQAHGDYRLFGLFLRRDSVDTWDLLVSGDWIDRDKYQAIRLLSDELRRRLEPGELAQISRVVTIEANDPVLATLGAFCGRAKGAHLERCTAMGVEILDAYLITFEPHPARPFPKHKRRVVAHKRK